MVAVNHVGVTVANIGEAVEWYTTVLGLRLAGGPVTVDMDSPAKARREDVFGPLWGGMTVAHLVGDNGAGVELFEFTQPPVEAPEDNFEFWKVGIFHLALTVDNIERVGRHISETGGRQRTAVHHLHGTCWIAYCEDPWGNIIELSSEPYEVLSDSHGHSMRADSGPSRA
jgi:catechol 2,3-dioxygenase-like lactoylglutathione lyase family enzyme